MKVIKYLVNILYQKKDLVPYMPDHTIQDVQKFWDENPLFTGEHSLENLEVFFKEHDRTYWEDVLSGINTQKTFLFPSEDQKTLDLGCGIGFWLSLFERKYNVKNLTGADLSTKSLEIAKQRVSNKVSLVQSNAEKLDFADATFDHVNCQGMVHHTPDTQAAINEIYRVLKSDGTASVSVYYDNIIIKLFPLVAPFIKLFFKLFGTDTGRNRDFSSVNSKDDLVKLYDGMGNPIGKSYTKSQFLKMLKKAGFSSIEFRYFFFPFRFIKIPVPSILRSLFVKAAPFMIVANCKKS